MSKLILDVEKYADLLNSVGQQGVNSGKKRPLSPVQCAVYIQRLIDEQKEDLHQIAEKLNLGKPKSMSNIYKKRDTTQVSMYLNLLKVSPKIQELAGWSTDEYPMIPFSTIAQLSSMPPEEQDIIVQSILQSKDKKRILGKEDVKKIKKWRNENPDLEIKECIEKVLKLKPATIITHLVVCEIHNHLRMFMDSNSDYKNKLLDILNQHLDGTFHDLSVGKSVIAISMDEEAYKIFYDHQYIRGSSFTRFLDEFLENRLG